MAVQEVMVPAGTQTPDPGGREPGRKKKRATNFIGVPTVTTRSMEKQKSLIPCKSIETLPSISGVLVRAIASCESDKGFSFAELKEVLSTKGYNVSKHCPNVKKRLHSLVSKGALVRMTRSKGSTFFVVRKYLESDRKTFESSEKIVGIKKAGAEKSTLCASENIRGQAKQGRSSRRKIGEARGKKLQPGETQPKQSTSKGGSAKRLQMLLKRAVSTAKRSVSRAIPLSRFSMVPLCGATSVIT
uniref:H15 domain-containing protein n=1 Tax=Varanus komodoensis TaxID=61221 RepID=A0A8D2Q4T8_VARKO